MLSVIVPIFNTGIYLRDCVKSICNQTYSDLQILLIDDGSEPETAQICDELAEEDRRIRVVHKLNEGVSVARNIGLDMATGDYVGFVDSDDTIDPHMFERMISAMNECKADIAMCDAVTITPGRPNEPDTIQNFKSSSLIETKNLNPGMLTRLAGSAWRCVYRRTAMLGKIRFPEGIKFSEDRIFNIALMGSVSSIIYIKESFYSRLIRRGSACYRFYPDMTEQIVKMRKCLIHTLEEYWGNDYIRAYEQQISGQILYAVTNFTSPSNGLSINNKINKLKKLCQNPHVIECLENSNNSDIRSKLIISKNYIGLFLIGICINYMHRILKRSQYI